MNAATLASLSLADGASVKVCGADADVVLTAELDPAVPDGAVRVSTAFAETLPLGGAFGQLSVEQA